MSKSIATGVRVDLCWPIFAAIDIVGGAYFLITNQFKKYWTCINEEIIGSKYKYIFKLSYSNNPIIEWI